MSELSSPEMIDSQKMMDPVSSKSEKLVDQSRDLASNLYGVDKTMRNVQAEGVLADDEQNTDSYTEQEFKAMGVEDQRAFLSELQQENKERNPLFILELQKNKKEGQLYKLAMAYGETEQKLLEKMEAFKKKKADIEASHNEQVAKVTEKYEKDSDKIKKKSKHNLIKLARKLKKNSSVTELRGKAQELASVANYFNFQRSEEISQGIASRRDDVKEDPAVVNLIDQISAERDSSDGELRVRKQQLITDLNNIEQKTKAETDQLTSSTITELDGLKQHLSQIEQDRDKAVQEFMDLEAQIEDKRRLQSSVDLLKDELREFSFADGQKIIADVENRAANTLSMESLSADKENFETQLDGIIAAGDELEAALSEARTLAEEANNNSYYDQLAILAHEKNTLKSEKENTHFDLVRELNEPFALAIENARSISPDALRQGESAINLISQLSVLGGEVKQAQLSIDVSFKNLNTFLTKLEERFFKLRSKLDESKRLADFGIDSTANHVSENIFTAQTIAQEAKEGDFSQVAESGNWFKKTFSKLFAKK